MENGIKRVHYFDHQFLRADDFFAEQEYHMQKRRRHSRLLHTWGIAQGLQVPDPPQGATGITICAGMAYDSEGREIVLTEDTPLDLQDKPPGHTVYVTVAYQEEQTDPTEETGVKGNTRWTEDAALAAWPVEPSQGPPDEVDNATKLILAQVERQGTAITHIDRLDRRHAGAIGGDLEVRRLTVSHENINPNQWPTLRCESPGRVDLTGDLRVTGNVNIGTPSGGSLRVMDALLIGRNYPFSLNPPQEIGLLIENRAAIGRFGYKQTLDGETSWNEQPIGMLDMKTSALPIVIRNYPELPSEAATEIALCEDLRAELPQDSLPCLVLWGVRGDNTVAFYYFTESGVYRALIQGQLVCP